MSVNHFGYPKFRAFLPGTNKPAIGAKLFVYEQGTSTKKNSYQDNDLTSANTNPIILDGNGECTVFVDGKCKLVLAPANDTDPPASAYWTMDEVGDAEVASAQAGGNYVPNGDFEESSDGSNPDGWTYTPDTGNTITWVDDLEQSFSGGYCTKFALGGTNAATITSDIFAVRQGINYSYHWAYYTNAAGIQFDFQIKYFYGNETDLSTVTPWSKSSHSTGAWLNGHCVSTVPANARWAKVQIVITGADTNVIYVDDIRAKRNDNYLQIGPSAHTTNSYEETGTYVKGSVKLGEGTELLNYYDTYTWLSQNAEWGAGGNWITANTGRQCYLEMNFGRFSFYSSDGVNAAGTINANVLQLFRVYEHGRIESHFGNFLLEPQGGYAFGGFTPNAPLHIHQNISGGCDFIQLTNSDTGGYDGWKIVGNVTTLKLWSASDGPLLFIHGGSGDPAGQFDFANQRLLISDDGGVSPGLDIVIAKTTLDSSAYLQFITDDSAGTSSAYGGVIGLDASHHLWVNAQESGMDLKLKSGSSAGIKFYTGANIAGFISQSEEWGIDPDSQGFTPYHDLHVHSLTAPYLQLTNPTTGTSSDGFWAYVSGSDAYLKNSEDAGDMILQVGGTSGVFAFNVGEGNTEWHIANNGGFYADAATGGSKGTGTVNAEGLYVDGVDVYPPTAVAGYFDTQGMLVHDDSADTTVLQIDSAVTVDTWESVGPTGAGSDNTWTALDSVPAGAKAIVVRIFHIHGGSTNGDQYWSVVWGMNADATPSTNYGNAISNNGLYNRSGALEANYTCTTAIIPINSAREFQARWSAGGTTPSTTIYMYLQGWIE